MNRVRRSTALLLALVLPGGWACAYTTTATVIVDIGGNSSFDHADRITFFGDGYSFTSPYSEKADLSWTMFRLHTLSPLTNATYLTTLGGYSSLGYYNPDFVPNSAACAPGAGIVPPGFDVTVARKYGCRFASSDGPITSRGSPVSDVGPDVARATGTLRVTDTTLTGTLTLVSTTDEPSGGTATSIGSGLNGYNYRFADGSPYTSAWYGTTTAGTYTLNLTGTFTSSSWQITGGTALFSDPGYACSQTAPGTPLEELCRTNKSTGGSPQANGAHLSWGWDPDGPQTGATVGPISINDTANNVVVQLAGVLGSLSINGAGQITTTAGEFRRAEGQPACSSQLQYDGARITCGTLLTAGRLVFTGTVAPDTDGDGIGDPLDNCRTTANPTQLDANQDGYGNLCDGDLNNSNLTTSTDFNLLRSVLNQTAGSSALAAAADMNGSGLVTSTDFNLLRARLNTAPGPSGLACAGTVPCAAP